MNERERLVELLQNVPSQYDGSRGVGKIADYLLANGVIVPPCKLGDTVWVAVSSLSNNLLELKVAYICIYVNYICACAYGGYTFDTNAIGKTVFLTREEAEAALAERSKG